MTITFAIMVARRAKDSDAETRIPPIRVRPDAREYFVGFAKRRGMKLAAVLSVAAAALEATSEDQQDRLIEEHATPAA